MGEAELEAEFKALEEQAIRRVANERTEALLARQKDCPHATVNTLRNPRTGGRTVVCSDCGYILA